MPGKLCTGKPENNIGAGRLSQSKAYCEGIQWRVRGSAAAFPITGNPHPSGSPDGDAWENGWNTANAAAGGTLSQADAPCCAVDGISVSP